MLGIIEPSLLENLLESIVQKDTGAVLAFLKLASDYEAEMILDELTLYLKSLLLENAGKLTPMIIELPNRKICSLWEATASSFSPWHSSK